MGDDEIDETQVAVNENDIEQVNQKLDNVQESVDDLAKRIRGNGGEDPSMLERLSQVETTQKNITSVGRFLATAFAGAIAWIYRMIAG